MGLKKQSFNEKSQDFELMKEISEQEKDENNNAGWWKQLYPFINRFRHILWLIIITVGLASFLILIPAPVRTELFNSLFTQRRLAGMLLLFCLLALSLLWSYGQQIDIWAFLYFNFHGSRPKWLDTIMLALTQGGNGLTALGFALFFYLWDFRILAYTLVLGTLTLWLVVEFVKAIIQRARPFEGLTQTRVVGLRAIGRSFPSGHTSQAFFLAALLVQYFQVGLTLAILLYGAATIVGITRMYVGAHYPRDVLAGTILGSLWGILGAIIALQLLR
jgi:membrane-associated phospholipid phosphatase